MTIETVSLISLLSNYGYLGILLAIVPAGEILLLLAGGLAFFGYLKILYVVLVAAFGVVIGDSLWYILGRTGREIAFLKVIGKKFIKKERFLHFEKQFEKHSVKTILFVRLIYGFRAFVLMAAGATKIRFYKFFFLNLFGSLIWAAIFTFLGYFFGHSYNFLKDVFKEIYIVAPFVFLILILIIYLVYFLKKKAIKKI